MTMLLAIKDVKWAGCLLTVALAKGSSPCAVMACLECATVGLYSPHGKFSDCDLDIAYVAKALGGL